jgi:hypothetical protein
MHLIEALLLLWAMMVGGGIDGVRSYWLEMVGSGGDGGQW